jgi:hypothetical protein
VKQRCGKDWLQKCADYYLLNWLECIEWKSRMTLQDKKLGIEENPDMKKMVMLGCVQLRADESQKQ